MDMMRMHRDQQLIAADVRRLAESIQASSSSLQTLLNVFS